MIVLTMLEPCSPHTHDVRTTAAAVPSASASRSPTSFVAPYTLVGFGCVPFVVRPIERAVEHVVGADLHEVGAGAVAALGEPSHGQPVVRRAPDRGRPRRRRRRSTPRS